jgi:hypothetical protein
MQPQYLATIRCLLRSISPLRCFSRLVFPCDATPRLLNCSILFIHPPPFYRQDRQRGPFAHGSGVPVASRTSRMSPARLARPCGSSFLGTYRRQLPEIFFPSLQFLVGYIFKLAAPRAPGHEARMSASLNRRAGRSLQPE